MSGKMIAAIFMIAALLMVNVAADVIEPAADCVDRSKAFRILR